MVRISGKEQPMKKILAIFAVFAAALALTACAKKHTHNPVKVEAIPATCTEDGSIAYYECEGCGKRFADEACKEQLDEEDIEVPGGHIYGTACDTICDREGCDQRTEPDALHTDSDGDGACDACREAIAYLYDHETDTYTVYTAEGLYQWAERAKNGANLVLAADIIMPEELTVDTDGDGIMDCNWYLHMITGNVSGNGHSITGLVVIGDNMFAGGLAGRVDNGAVVRDVHLRDVQVAGINATGGITGCLSNGSVIGCSVTGTVKNERNSSAGGIVGQVGFKTTVIGCRNYAQVIGAGTVGGIAGEVTSSGSVIACINAGSVSGGGTYGASLGGVAGRNDGAITACGSVLEMTVAESELYYVGGITGINNMTLANNYWSASGTVPAHGDGKRANVTNAVKVNGQSVTWETAMWLMNEALVNGEIRWRFEKNTGADADSMPLIPVAW